MTGCTLTSFDLGTCATSTLLGWVPSWFWTIWPYWPWAFWTIVALIILGILARVKEVFGWPGVFAVWSVVPLIAGFIIRGKIDARVMPHPTTGQPTVQFPGHTVPVVVQKPTKVKQRTIFDDLGDLLQRK